MSAPTGLLGGIWLIPSRCFQTFFFFFFFNIFIRASLVAQGLGICLPMQGTRVRPLVWEDPTCCGATKPMHLEPVLHSKGRPLQ